MKGERKNKFNVGDEAILTKEGKHRVESNDYAGEAGVKAMRPYVVCESLFERNIFNSSGKLHDTIYLLGTDKDYLGHPATKFRKVERVKWALVNASQLKRGDIIKPTLADTEKYVLLSNKGGIIKLLPSAPISNTSPDGYFQEEGEYVVRFYSSGSFYKLINISEL